MFRPLEAFIGLRYLRSRRWRRVPSFMTAASLLGIGLGVAALIVVLSVMNGLETETRTRLFGMSAHVTLSAPGGLADPNGLRDALAAIPGVAAASPYVDLEAMLAAGVGLRPAVLRGVLPGDDASVADIDRFLESGDIAALTPGGRRIVIGRGIALALGLRVGDQVTVLVPRITAGRIAPRYTGFVVAGVFEAGVTEHDATLALIHMQDASELAGLAGAAEGIAVRLDQPLALTQFRDAAAALISGFDYSDWSEEHRNLFTAIAIEKVMMTIILAFIVGIAAFNVVTSLMRIVIEKERDIAILRTCGLEPGRVARVFLVQGVVIGLVGALLGVGLGLALAYNVDVIVPWLEATFDFKIMPGDVYYVTVLPSEVHVLDVVVIPLLALVLAGLATIYPARRAAAIAPAAALRYE